MSKLRFASIGDVNGRGPHYIMQLVGLPDGHWRLAKNSDEGQKIRRPCLYPMNTKRGEEMNQIELGRRYQLALEGKLPVDNNKQGMTVGEWVDKYIETPEFKALAGAKLRAGVLKRVVRDGKLGKLALAELTKDTVEDFRAALKVRESQFGKPLALGTVNLWQSYLSACLALACDRGYRAQTGLTVNVAALVAQEDPENERDRVLTEDEWARLKAAAPAWMLPILLVAYYLGMRKSEIVELKWDAVILTGRIPRIRLKKWETKNGDKREIPLLPELEAVFRQLAAGPRHISGSIFLGVDGQPVTVGGHNGLQHGWDVLRDELAIGKRHEKDGLAWHDIRHCAATNLRRAGVHDKMIMRMMGWRSVKSLYRYLNISSDEDLQEAVAKLNVYHTGFGHTVDTQLEHVS